MALPLSNSFEGGSDTTAITTLNSGGASGDAFNVVSGSLCLFGTAAAAHGSLGMSLVEPGVGALSYVGWDSNSIPSSSHLYGRCYFKLSASPTANTRIVRFLSGANIGCNIIVSTTRTVQWGAGANGDTFSGSASSALSTNTLYRIEWDVVFGGSGNMRGYIFAGDSTTSTTTFTALSTQTGAITAADTLQVGVINGTPTSITFGYDDIQLNSTGLPGPYASDGTQSLGRWAGLDQHTSGVYAHGRRRGIR